MFSHVFAVEIIDAFVSRWMYIELLNASRIVGRENLWIFNVKDRCELEKLSSIAGLVEHDSIISRIEDLGKIFRVVVLDPEAPEELKPSDFTGRTLVVVGGIMGDHPPRGRTRKEVTWKLKGRFIARNLGPGQFTIDGAIYMARAIAFGRTLQSIPVQRGLILRGDGFEVHLPYAYPLENGSVVISREEVDYILNKLEEDEARALSDGKTPSICSD
ncbi:MAG: RNA methyltransferase [Infirmifilum sp.]